MGQIIGAVVAESKEQARRAAQRVKVTYQDLLPVFFTIEEAIQHQSFFDLKRKLERGDMDKAFETVDQILEGKTQWFTSVHLLLLMRVHVFKCLDDM